IENKTVKEVAAMKIWFVVRACDMRLLYENDGEPLLISPSPTEGICRELKTTRARAQTLLLKDELCGQLRSASVVQLVRSVQVIDRAKITRTRFSRRVVTDAWNCRALAGRIDYRSGQQRIVEGVDKFHSQLNLLAGLAIQGDVLPQAQVRVIDSI